MKKFNSSLKKLGVEIISNAFDLENFYVLKINKETYIGKHIKKSERISVSATKDAYKKLLSVNCDSIVSIKHLIDLEGELFVIMEYVNWVTLNKYMKEIYFEEIDNGMKKLKYIFLNIAKSIDKMHLYDLIHADITGSNLLISESLEVKIIDFDFAIIDQKMPKSIDILKYNSLIFEFIFEQIYLNEKYNLFFNDDVRKKKEYFFKISSQHKTYDSCLNVFSAIFSIES